MTAHDLDEHRCVRCAHPPSWHRLDDSLNISPTDSAAEFRCIGYDCEAPGPFPRGGRACACPDFLPPMAYLKAVGIAS